MKASPTAGMARVSVPVLGGRGHHTRQVVQVSFPRHELLGPFSPVKPFLPQSEVTGGGGDSGPCVCFREPTGAGLRRGQQCHSLKMASSLHLLLFCFAVPGSNRWRAHSPTPGLRRGGRSGALPAPRVRKRLPGAGSPAPAGAILTGDAERTKVREAQRPHPTPFWRLSSSLNSEQSSPRGGDKMAPSGRSGEKQEEKSCFQTGRVNKGARQ